MLRPAGRSHAVLARPLPELPGTRICPAKSRTRAAFSDQRSCRDEPIKRRPKLEAQGPPPRRPKAFTLVQMGWPPLWGRRVHGCSSRVDSPAQCAHSLLSGGPSAPQGGGRVGATVRLCLRDPRKDAMLAAVTRRSPSGRSRLCETLQESFG